MKPDISELESCLYESWKWCPSCHGQGSLPTDFGWTGEVLESRECQTCADLRRVLQRDPPRACRQLLVRQTLMVPAPELGLSVAVIPLGGPHALREQGDTVQLVVVEHSAEHPAMKYLERTSDLFKGPHLTLRIEYILPHGADVHEFRFRGVPFKVSSSQTEDNLTTGFAVSNLLTPEQVLGYLQSQDNGTSTTECIEPEPVGAEVPAEQVSPEPEPAGPEPELGLAEGVGGDAD